MILLPYQILLITLCYAQMQNLQKDLLVLEYLNLSKCQYTGETSSNRYEKRYEPGDYQQACEIAHEVPY